MVTIQCLSATCLNNCMVTIDPLIDAQIALRAKQYDLALESALKVLKNHQSPQAQSLIARLAWDGLLHYRDDHPLPIWLEQQILEGNAYAHFISAILDASGQIYERNIPRAIEHYQVAINKGIADAMAGYANLLLPKNDTTTTGVAPDINTALRLLEQAFGLGSREAAYLLGAHYRYQKHSPVNLQKAYYYLNIARLLMHENGKLLFLDIAQIKEANDFIDVIEKSEQAYYRILSLKPEYPCI